MQPPLTDSGQIHVGSSISSPLAWADLLVLSPFNIQQEVYGYGGTS